MVDEKEINALFGVTSEDVEKGDDIIPSLNLKALLEGESHVDVEIVESKPREIEFTDKEGEKVKAPVITVNYEDTEFTLWLSAKTMRMGFARLFRDNNGNLKGVKARITSKEATHAKFGKYNAYNVQEKKDGDEE